MANWTDDQARAIYEPSGEGNILVSAAAGSGKTAVLVERIAAMITRAENPVSIDNLLVVTFTEAAAAEMKERIIFRISEAQREAAEKGDKEKSRFLKEQMHLTSSADIDTIDAFCLGVVKNNFHILGIDPNFAIMDGNEGEMLMEDTFAELFTELYEEGNERFDALIKMYASNRDDEGLKSVIRKVYNFTQSFAEPMAWLRDKAAMYSEDMTESRWANGIILGDKKAYALDSTRDAFNTLLAEMRNISDDAHYWGKLYVNVCKCCEAVSALEKADTWDEVYEFYNIYIAKKIYLGNAINTIPKNIGADAATWQSFYNRYDRLRDLLRELCSQLPKLPRAEFNKEVHAAEMKRTIDDIVWLSELFNARYEEKKDKRNLKSFSDIEHLAYRLFSGNENLRMEYSERYEEILIDEFQDTNGLQDAIFTLISRDNKNIFMVGDLKQSIYRFRGGDPMIFKGKSREYAMSIDAGKLITLSQNFRSRMQVIDSINAVFSAMMSDNIGDVDYNGAEALSRDKDRECYDDSSENDYFSELYRIAVIGEETEDGEDINAVKAEAAQIADRIRALVDGHYKVQGRGGEYRDIEYRDIVILMKSVKGDGAVIRDVLESRGVRAFVQKDEYFERREIKLMLSLISLINNHLQDIPLAAVMRSPIGGFSESELALIRINQRYGSFYKAVKSYRAGGDADDREKRLEAKCRRFVKDLDRWRGYVKRKSIASLIWTLYEETGFYDFMGALEGGEEAQANLKLLYERAKRYEASGFRGIFNFIRYIERMENRREDISGAQLINENHNVVRIMTIHKSKGLEFPVVFLARTTKKINYTHSRDENRVVLHKELGIGADYYNYEDMYFKKVLFSDSIRKENRREHLSEEMRLLYVAATRAREKLIVTASYYFGSRDSYIEQLNSWHENFSRGFNGASVAKGARSFADWIIPVAQSGGKCWRCEDVEVSSMQYEEGGKQDSEVVLENPEELRALAWRILEFEYKFPKSGAIPAKTSVTAIKEMADEENIERTREWDDDPVYMTQKPAFLREERMGARIGTAHHQVMAYIDLEKMSKIPDSEYEEFVAGEIVRIAGEGQIERVIAEDKDIADTILQNICGFFRSDMGKALFNAKAVYREKPFEIEITAREYDPTLDDAYENDKVVVQGIIDLYFENESGDIILVDYKTDRCKTKEEQEEIGRKYSKQIELYERAMEKILKRNVKEKYLYLFSAQSVLQL